MKWNARNRKWHPYRQCVPSFHILGNHKAIKLVCAQGTKVMCGMLPGTQGVGLLNGKQGVRKIGLFIPQQLKHRLAGSQPSQSSSNTPKAFHGKPECLELASLRGQLCWSRKLAWPQESWPRNLGQNSLENPSYYGKCQHLLPLSVIPSPPQLQADSEVKLKLQSWDTTGI